MTSRRQNKLSKNPFVRLLRMIYRSLRVIFRPKSKRLALAALYEQRGLERRRVQEALDTQRESEARQVQESVSLEQELDDCVNEQFITIGELLRKVEWQKNTKVQSTPTQDFSLN